MIFRLKVEDNSLRAPGKSESNLNHNGFKLCCCFFISAISEFCYILSRNASCYSELVGYLADRVLCDENDPCLI